MKQKIVITIIGEFKNEEEVDANLKRLKWYIENWQKTASYLGVKETTFEIGGKEL